VVCAITGNANVTTVNRTKNAMRRSTRGVLRLRDLSYPTLLYVESVTARLQWSEFPMKALCFAIT
ncbi:MAG: hypothetical protein WBV31_12490, partial [Terriglobales bacterium]